MAVTTNDIINEKDGFIQLGKSRFSLEYLRNVTLEDAIPNLTNQFVDENRVRNAWKRANKKK
jgi:hypothetical protein